MLLLALFMPWQAKAQETLTVCNGSTTSTNASIRNGNGSQSENIYPADMLSDMAGGTITSVKFFASTSSASYTNKVTVYVQEVTTTTETTSAWQYNQNTATRVYEGTTLSVASGELEIEFSTPFDYVGGNLVQPGTPSTRTTNSNVLVSFLAFPSTERTPTRTLLSAAAPCCSSALGLPMPSINDAKSNVES